MVIYSLKRNTDNKKRLYDNQFSTAVNKYIGGKNIVILINNAC